VSRSRDAIADMNYFTRSALTAVRIRTQATDTFGFVDPERGALAALLAALCLLLLAVLS
jgi:hypothetical protein